jgi:hypothetical protein
MAQRGIFTVEPKEPNFFSNDEVYELGEMWYSNLFDGVGESTVCGEASTHYTKLPRYPDAAKRAHAYAPNAKLIYVMRHPVDRLVSHYIHNWSMGFIGRHVSLEDALQDYDNFVTYSQYSLQLKPWFELFGQANVLPVFFDRLMNHSDSELSRICSFIGYSGDPKWVGGGAAENASMLRLRRFPMYPLVIESKPAVWARSFIPKRLREFVKSKLRMPSRPELTSATRAKLEHAFDEDLAVIGEWLGAKINCDNFKSVTRDKSLEWIVK